MIMFKQIQYSLISVFSNDTIIETGVNFQFLHETLKII